MSLSRRLFLTSAAVLLPTVTRAGQAGGPGAALGADDGELYYVGPTQDPVRIKISPPGGGRFAMITQEMAPGSRIPIHLHEHEDEIIFIQRGEGRATIGERQVPLQAGATLYVPQGTWHGGENSGAGPMSWIAIYSPSGFEGYFREIGVRPDGTRPAALGPDEREARDRRYGIRYPASGR